VDAEIRCLLFRVQSQFWWFFIPAIVVSVIKSAFIAVAQHRGLLQALGQLGCELLLFLLLLAGRPFDSKTSNILSCIIAVVGMISYGQAQTRPHATSRTGSQEVDCSEALLARVFFLGKEIMVVLQLHDYEVRRKRDMAFSKTWSWPCYSASSDVSLCCYFFLIAGNIAGVTSDSVQISTPVSL